MWPSDGNQLADEEQPKSQLACHACRRRKIRCGREFPVCAVCKSSSQECEYPVRILKPGPKLGSTHRNRKRRRGEESNDGELALGADSNSPPPDPPETSPNVIGKEVIQLREHDSSDNHEPPGTARSRQALLFNNPENHESTQPDSINIHDLSFILHPAHETTTPKKTSSPNSTSGDLEQRKSMLVQASHALGLTADALEIMIKMYFDNMTAINIFHEPTFEEKLLNIGSPPQLHALLASMLAFSARFCGPESRDGQDYVFNALAGMTHRPQYFLEAALGFVEDALKECGDEAPQLCVLQALILVAHCQLTQGVRGKAWRSLGTCVRLAYELNLHLVEAEYPKERYHAEERRRAWWAVWEMDVFASTVRRCPTAVDWSQMETLLPIEDEYWFQGTPRASCFLEKNPIARWKALQESGNQSAKAWFIVINSFMKEAQSISSPKAIPIRDLAEERRPRDRSRKDQMRAPARTEEAQNKLETLANCVRCFVMALPPSLVYRNQYLGFDARQPGEMSSLRQSHCGLYNIHVMTQLSKLMIHHYDVFSESTRAGRTAQERKLDRQSHHFTRDDMNNRDNVGMHQYFEAADGILGIVHRSSNDHIHHINAFLASTIWLASAVQLVRREFGTLGTNQSLVESKFEVLNMTYKKFVSFWGIQTAMQQNLETLEAQLEVFRRPVHKKCTQSYSKVDYRTHTSKTTDGSYSSQRPQPKSTVQDTLGENHALNVATSSYKPYRVDATRVTNGLRSSSNEAVPNHITTNSQVQDGQDRQRQQHDERLTPVATQPLSPALSVLEYMHFTPQPAVHLQAPLEDRGLVQPPLYMPDQGIFPGHEDDQHIMNGETMPELDFGTYGNGLNGDFPSYIGELLTGAYTY